MKPALSKICWALGLFALLACSGGSGAPEAALGGPPGNSLSHQAGPVERPPVTVDSGPQESCRDYVLHPEEFEPEEVPEICKTAYENAPRPFERPPVNIPERVIPVIEGPAVNEPAGEGVDLRRVETLEDFENRLGRPTLRQGLPAANP